jgi:hypothetical protein
VRAVTKLGVMDVPGLSLDTPTPVSLLAQHTYCNEEYMYRLLRYVSQFGLLVEEPGQQFRWVVPPIIGGARYIAICWNMSHCTGDLAPRGSPAAVDAG